MFDLGIDFAAFAESDWTHAPTARTQGKWKNNKTGNYGSTTVVRVTNNGDGVVCKSYREQVHTSAESVTKEGTACRGPGGSWKAST